MSVPAKKLRSPMSVAFDWKHFCFFCSSKVDFRNKDRNKPRRVMAINIKNNVLLAAENRKGDWGEEVFGRLVGCNDLGAEEAWQSLARKPIRGRLVVQLMRKKYVILKCCVNV